MSWKWQIRILGYPVNVTAVEACISPRTAQFFININDNIINHTEEMYIAEIHCTYMDKIKANGKALKKIKFTVKVKGKSFVAKTTSKGVLKIPTKPLSKG
ncbi:MAG: hypothetical protein IKF11_05345 [Methanobrevibacter sp.]|nr:hypothetical protein [Methanobrevibacter sp.]